MARTVRVGVHGRNNPHFDELDFRVIRDAQLESVKMMSQTHPGVFDRVKKERPGIEIITRLYTEGFGPGGHPSAADFARQMEPVMKSLQPYCTKFHVHNEPNHTTGHEGWGSEEHHAQDFNNWFIEVFDRLKNAHPWAWIGFPGMAVPHFLHNDRRWLDICRPAIEKADWLGVHSYWQTPPGRDSMNLNSSFGLNFRYYHDKYPNKVLEILECGNSNGQNPEQWDRFISEEQIAQEYVQWMQEVFKYLYIGSANFFILSSQDPQWAFFSWRTEHHHVKPVVHRLATMHRPSLQPVSIGESLRPKPKPGPIEIPNRLPGQYTNQNIITAFKRASNELGWHNWRLMEKAGLSVGELAKNRDALYSGPKSEDIDTLTPEEKTLVKKHLEKLHPTVYTNQNIITALHNASLKVGLGPWDLLYRAGLTLNSLVNAGRQNAYTGLAIEDLPNLTEEQRRLIIRELPGRGITTFGARSGQESAAVPNYLSEMPLLLTMGVAPPEDQQLPLEKAANAGEARVVQTWNRFGWLLTMVSDQLALEEATAVAVLANEVTPHGFASDGRLLIRFDVPTFWRFWGHTHEESFDQQFRYDESRPWQGHRYRAEVRGEWRNVHENQASEWASFEAASGLDVDAARASIAMGLSQLMGFSYQVIGYRSPSQMLDAMRSGERYHILALFDLLAGPASDHSRLLSALQQDDFETFAALRFGSIQAARYAHSLSQAREVFERIRGGD